MDRGGGVEDEMLPFRLKEVINNIKEAEQEIATINHLLRPDTPRISSEDRRLLTEQKRNLEIELAWLRPLRNHIEQRLTERALLHGEHGHEARRSAEAAREAATAAAQAAQCIEHAEIIGAISEELNRRKLRL